MKLFRFKSFNSRILTFILILLGAFQLSVFLMVDNANIKNARASISENLQVGLEVFNRLLSNRTENLFQYARLLSSDYAFKPAFFSGDHGTILSAMENHLNRLEEADLMVVADLERKEIANTLAELSNSPSWHYLIGKAENDEFGEAQELTLINGVPYQIIVVPYFSPEISGWIILGFEVDLELAETLKEIVKSDIFVLLKDSDGKTKMHFTTFQAEGSPDFDRVVAQLDSLVNKEVDNEELLRSYQFNEHQYIALSQPLDVNKKIFAVLQRSFDQAMEPFSRLQTFMQWLFAISLVLSVMVAALLARRITKPVKDLQSGANKIQEGDYESRISIRQEDELGELAKSFNEMAVGLKEKEKVRSLLGKVVSNDIAQELIAGGIELGGEEKVATVLFSDIRSFTNLCEGQSPQDILALLNRYLTEMSDIVEEHHGVIDKYIGDAIMAIFGTPVERGNDAANGVACALEMVRILSLFNAEQTDSAKLEIGIGLNTGELVAGNMGSPSRLNYTVIGDCVNLASRIEGLTKYYGVPVLVSESCVEKAPDFLYREVDLVKVKGKDKPVSIFQPICVLGTARTEQKELVSLSGKLLSEYRSQKWSEVGRLAEQLKVLDDSNLPKIYLERSILFQSSPPSENWDYSYRFEQK